MIEKLRDNPWVQSPKWESVQEILSKINPSHTYYSRGSGEATADLNELEESHRKWVKPLLDLSDFPFFYAVNGTTESINQWRLTDTRPWQFLNGDYLWPQIVSGNGESVDVNNLSKEKVLYISNPSAIDGNFLNQKIVDRIQSVNCPVVLDCTYIGSTAIKNIPLFSRTEQVMFSFSKGWGLIGQRLGLLYTKRPHSTLSTMKKLECWNYQSVQIMQKIVENFKVDTIFNVARETQDVLCREYNLNASDTYFIANSRDKFYDKRKRAGDLARICLTPIWS